MKSFSAAAACLWLAIAMEFSWRQMLPQGCVLLPVACGLLCWMRTGTAVLVCGLALLADWVIRPTMLPLLPAVLPLIAIGFNAAGTSGDLRAARRLRIPTPLLVPAMTIIGLCLQSLTTIPWQQPEAWEHVARTTIAELQASCLIAVPLSAVVAILIRTADEFGLRRTFEVPA